MVGPTEGMRERIGEGSQQDIQNLLNRAEYREVLQNGIRNGQDLQRAFELLTALEPEDAGLLVKTAIELQIPFDYQDSTHFPLQGARAATELSFERISDRSLYEVGRITFNTGNPEQPELVAPGLTALKHELVHAIPFEHLPKKYQDAFTAEICAEPRNINSIYRSVFSNLIGDEALAMLSGVSLLESAKKNGIDLSAHPAQRRDVAMKEGGSTAAGSGTPTFHEIAEQLRSNNLYYSSTYRTIALRIACHRRFGELTDKIDVADLINSLTTPMDLGGIPVRIFDIDKARGMFMRDVMPRLERNAGSLIMSTIFMAPDLLNSLNKFLSDDKNQVQEFFSKDMDRLVEQIARLIGDEHVQLREVAFSPSETPVVAPRATPVRAAAQTKEVDRSEVTADTVEILGKYVELMHKLAGTTATEVVANLHSYLDLAEHCDPHSSAQVYSLLLTECLERNLFSLADKRELAFSLLRSGYEERGSELLASTIEDMSIEGYYNFVCFEEKEIQYLIEHDRQAVLERYLDKVIELNAQQMQEFDQWIETTSDYRADQAGGHERISRAVLELIASVTPELQSKLNPTLLRTVKEQVDRLAGQLERWQQKKIRHYIAEVAGEGRYDSIDEMTARNPQWGGGFEPDDSQLLIGRASNSNPHTNLCELIARCLRSNLTFEQGLALLDRYPVSQQKLYIYCIAADNLPCCADDQARARLAQGIEDALHKVKRGYRAWGFSTSTEFGSLNPEDVGTPPETDYKNTQLYQKGMMARAKLLADARAPDLRAQAAQMMLTLPTQNKYYAHPARLERSTTVNLAGLVDFNPAYVRAQAYAELADKLPATDRIEISRNALLLVRSPVKIYDGYEVVQIDTVLKVAETACKHGDNDNFERAKETLEYLGRGLPDKPSAQHLERSWEQMKDNYRRATTFVQLIDSTRRGGDELEKLVTRMESDVQTKRGHFSLVGQIQALLCIQELKPCPLNQVTDRQLVKRLGDNTVDRYIQSICSGYGERFFTDCWPSLVRAIGEMPVDDAMRDRMMTRLIERGTPRGMLGAETDKGDSSESALPLIYDGFKALDFVLANPALPSAEAVLLDRLSEQISSVSFSHLDTRVAGAIKGLGWMYKRLATSDIVTPERKPELEKLRQNDDYRNLLEQMFAFATPRQAVPSLAETAAAVDSAVDKRDFAKLKELSPAVHKHLADITTATHDKLSRGPEQDSADQRVYLLQEDLQGTLFSALHESLTEAYASGDHEKSCALLTLLTKGSTVDECMAKVEYYAELLGNKDVPLEDKRELYREFSRSKYISRYASALTKDLAARGETEREIAAMLISLPWHGTYNLVNQKDTLLALVEDSDLEGVRLFQKTYREFRTLIGRGFKFDPTNSYGWELFAENFRSFDQRTWSCMMSNAAEAICVMRNGKPKELERCESNSDYPNYYKSRMSRRYGAEVSRALGAKYQAEDGQESFNYFSHLRFAGLLTRAPEPSEVDPILARMKDCYDRRERLQDRVAGRQIEMPEIFKDQPELVQFLASRYMLKLSRGERQDLLLSMEGVSKGEALLRFFERAHIEKIGQFLSVWPQVPSEIRRELSLLQMSVLPSDREEVAQVVAKEVHPISVKNCLLEHLSQEAVGSGTIGDVFKSQLPDGSEVAIKVITPSKEENIRKGMKIMKRVRDLIEIYGEEIEGGREVVRFVDMYIDMVEKELDLRNELRNYHSAKDAYGDTFGMAQHYDQYSSAKVLLMQYFPDIKRITDPEVPAEAATSLMELIKQHFLMTQVLQTGLVLTDLQPGNILYLDQDPSRPYLLDFGQQTHLSPEDCEKMMNFGRSVFVRDPKGMVQFMESVSDRTARYDEAAARHFEDQVREVFANVSPHEEDFTERLSLILRHASAAGLLVHYQFLRVTKGFATLEGSANETARTHQT